MGGWRGRGEGGQVEDTVDNSQAVTGEILLWTGTLSRDELVSLITKCSILFKALPEIYEHISYNYLTYRVKMFIKADFSLRNLSVTDSSGS